MKMSKDKALIINLFTMVVLIVTAICDFIFFNGDKLFRVILMAVTLWLMYFVYKRTFLKKRRASRSPGSWMPKRTRSRFPTSIRSAPLSARSARTPCGMLRNFG